MTTIAISNLKGGTGKTTTAILLAEALLRRGRSVCVVDLDPQGSATEWAQLADDAGASLAFPVIVGNVRTITKPTGAEFTILDCPPGNPTVIDAALRAADSVIIPVQASAIETERMWDTIDIAGRAKAHVLLTSVLHSAKSPEALVHALDHEGVSVYPGGIPRREAIRYYYGNTPGADLFGYQAVADTFIEHT